MNTNDQTESTDLSFGASIDGVRSPAAIWPEGEIKRTRNFSLPVEGYIDARRLMGKFRNAKIELVMEWVSDAFVGNWTVSLETKVGPWRMDRDNMIKIQLCDAQGAAVVSAIASGFAIQCHDWLVQTWTGALTVEQFDSISKLKFDGGCKRKALIN